MKQLLYTFLFFVIAAGSLAGQCDPSLNHISFSNITADTCTAGTNTGSFTYTISQGTPPFDIFFNEVFVETIATNQGSFSGLAADVYGIDALDSQGCDFLGLVDINSVTDIDFTFTVEEAECGAEDLNSIDLTVTTPGLTFLWNNGATTEDLVDVPSGTYNVRMTTPDGCQQVFSYILGTSGVSPTLAIFPDLCGSPSYLEAVPLPGFALQWILPGGVVRPIVTAFDARVDLSQAGTYVLVIDDPSNPCPDSAIYILPELPAPCRVLSGRLLLDEGNCQVDGTEIPFPEWFVRLQSLAEPDSTYLARTDQSGNWVAAVPAGDYTVQLSGYNQAFDDCTPLTTVTMPATGPDPAPVDILATAAIECAAMQTSIGAIRFRRCFDNQIIVNYCNDGSVTAENATLFVGLDEFLIYQSASLTPSQVLPNGLQFDLGDVAPLQCGTISITVTVSCEAVLGQSHCISVNAKPGNGCPGPDPAWSGATVEVTTECTNDGTVFRIQNTGEGDMTVPLTYGIVEDGVMLLSAPTEVPPLLSGESVDVILPNNQGAAYFIQTNQEPFSPGFTTPTAFVEGCTTAPGGAFSLGFANQLSDGDDRASFDRFCLENIGSYDPNDKQGTPRGYGDDHDILPGTPLEYMIRFQNTGTDTAFTVAIRDTLSAAFDLSTLRFTTASHQYSAEITAQGAMLLTFSNILLPDSTTNLAGSQGFITYTISPRADLPLQTRIENTAAIYFDFNDPIITNTTFHTIDTAFVPLVSGLRPPRAARVDLQVFPNPATGAEVLQLQHHGTSTRLSLTVYNALGRVVRRQALPPGRSTLRVADLPRGLYILQARTAAGQDAGSQKLMVY
ncbi:MAG: T9SS type A sorting domain-containing protein [Saprospiraceae bacterium]